MKGKDDLRHEKEKHKNMKKNGNMNTVSMQTYFLLSTISGGNGK